MGTFIVRELVNLAEITLVANCFIKKNELYEDILHDSSSEKYYFTFGDKLEKNSVKEWVEELKKRGAEDLYLDYDVPKYVMNIANINRTPAGIICKYKKGVGAWHKKWVGKDIYYTEELVEDDYYSNNTKKYFDQNYNYFKECLIRIAKFSEILGMNHWKEYFEKALELEDIENSKKSIISERLYNKIPDKNVSCYAMAMQAYPFGGMGSWCDDAYWICRQKDLSDQYDKVSNWLYRGIMKMLSYSTTNVL